MYKQPNNCKILYLFNAAINLLGASSNWVTSVTTKTGRSVNTYHVSKEFIFTARK
jgi:hypothetical protein